MASKSASTPKLIKPTSYRVTNIPSSFNEKAVKDLLQLLPVPASGQACGRTAQVHSLSLYVPLDGKWKLCIVSFKPDHIPREFADCVAERPTILKIGSYAGKHAASLGVSPAALRVDWNIDQDFYGITPVHDAGAEAKFE